MADTSPGRVQTLRAMFTEKDSVIGLLPPPNGKIGPKPWKKSLGEDVSSELVQGKDQTNITLLDKNTQAFLKLLQQRECEMKETFSSSAGVPQKPVIGPKPLFAKQNCRSLSTTSSSQPQAQKEETSPAPETTNNPPKIIPPKPKRNSYPRKIDETSLSKCLESLMFHHAYSNGNVTSDEQCALNGRTLKNDGNSDTTVPRPFPADTGNSNKIQDASPIDPSIPAPKITNDAKAISQLSLINSDNYICKSNCKFIRNKLPPKDRLGPPPLKPCKPSCLRIPQHLLPSSMQPPEKVIRVDTPSSHKFNVPGHSLQKSSSSIPLRHLNLCPPRPTTAPPVPPCSQLKSSPSSSMSPMRQPLSSSSPYPLACQAKAQKSLVEEMEELYEDTLLGRNCNRTSLLITDFKDTEQEELYDDAVEHEETDVAPPCPPKPRNPPPPPPPPTFYLDPIGNVVSEELYQDAAEVSDDEFYEEMPSTETPEESHYINNRKELEKLKREKEKRLRKESKEKEKKEKEMEKVKRKFGLLGDEIPIDAGVVISDSRGGRCDLPVGRGEKVYILRIEGNPAGKWLVRNKKGKYGYVELTNIEVDPDSVKSVMIERRTSVISSSNSEEIYSEAYSEQEAIYETTY